MKRIRLIIHGRVQGVMFRASAYDVAQHLPVTGYIRNLPGGDVEVTAEGDDQPLTELMEYCRTGPPSAQVQRMDSEWLEATGEFERFDILY